MIQSETGNSRTVVTILNTVCTILICVWVIFPCAHAGFTILRYAIAIILKMIVPMILKIRCINAAVFAFFFAPTLDRIAVTQVPIFCPMII